MAFELDHVNTNVSAKLKTDTVIIGHTPKVNLQRLCRLTFFGLSISMCLSKFYQNIPNDLRVMGFFRKRSGDNLCKLSGDGH